MKDRTALPPHRPDIRVARARGRSKGQSLVEFALVLPVLLLLLLIAVDFGRLFFSWIETNNAAREGAAYGAAHPTDTSGIATHVRQETNAQAQVGEGAITITTACANPVGNTIPCSNASGGGGSGNTLTVTVREPFTFLTPGIGNIFGGNLTMGAAATSAVLGEAAGTGGTSPGGCSGPSATIALLYQGGLEILVDPAASQPDSGICAISGYNWDFGDGITDVGTAVGTPHTYAGPGTYTVTLQVTNQAGESTVTQVVTVPPATPPPTPVSTPTPTPLPSATPAPTPTPSPTPMACTVPSASFTYTKDKKKYSFADTSTVTDPVNCPITAWLWDFGDGMISNAMNPIHTYGSSSSHTVTLRVTNSAGQSAPYSHSQ